MGRIKIIAAYSTVDLGVMQFFFYKKFYWNIFPPRSSF